MSCFDIQSVRYYNNELTSTQFSFSADAVVNYIEYAKK